ncbi:citrate transporter [Petrotoga mexicana DSM 14811]|uniref:Citrate transporter n=1 Tax=Petrotoga mexicana DSM 14811 TaxID=1122954 RepID=A0A2K1PBN8_9BACT|nr:SLC13 family permease [Petrotoga mexicana]PNS00203.1 citrate transporter [Petrotoga mexicana DSM 14811]
MSIYALTSLIVFIIVVVGMVFQKIDRTLIAMLGAIFLLGVGVFPNQIGAIKEYVDYNTLLLLLGMMVFVETLRKTGIFTFLGLSMLRLFGNNTYTLFISLIFLVALFSGFIDNVTTVLVFIPMTFAITDSLNINYLPFVLGEIFASNIGGMATIIGDPPNIMIASAAGFSFSEFALVMYPIALINLVFMDILFIFIFKKDLQIKFDKDTIKSFDTSHLIEDKRSFFLSIILFVTVIIAFSAQHFLGLESSTIAIIAGFFSLLILAPNQVRDTLNEVEWESLLFFFGLFLITGAMEETGLIADLSNVMVKVAGNSVKSFSMFILPVASLISGFIDNIPFTATMIPVVQHLQVVQPGIFSDLSPVWYSLAMGACLGGNATSIGASANIIGLAMLTQFKNKTILFKDFAKYGLLLVLGNVVISEIYLLLLFF